MRRTRSRLEIYVEESRDVAWSLALVVPLLLAYEVSSAILQPPVRNAAEQAVADALGHIAPATLLVLRRLVMGGLLVGALLALRRPRNRVARPHHVLAEALLLAGLLGPLVARMVGGIGLSVAAEPAPAAGALPSWLPFLLSIGAGLWEEIVFRFGLLGGLAFLLARLPALHRRGAVGVAVVLSALAFALYHHLGAAGEPFTLDRFAFRAVAGTILGVLFVTRGLAVVVYMHVFYDVFCDLRMTLS